MRLSFGLVTITLALMGLTVTSAAAHIASAKEQASYPACSCQFG